LWDGAVEQIEELLDPLQFLLMAERTRLHGMEFWDGALEEM
jgi:hypothetical protein